MERLRFVARSSGVDDALLVREAAGALASVADDPHAIVTACRQMVGRQPASGPLLWLAARVMGAPDARAELRVAMGELADDSLGAALSDCLPHGATVCVVGRPDGFDEAHIDRGDLEVVEVALDDEPLGGWFDDDRTTVTLRQAGALAGRADLVLVAADAVGPEELLAGSGALGVVAAAHVQGTPVWAPVAVGRILPGGLWQGLRARIGDADTAAMESVPVRLVDQFVDQRGPFPASGLQRRTTCPDLASLGPRS